MNFFLRFCAFVLFFVLVFSEKTEGTACSIEDERNSTLLCYCDAFTTISQLKNEIASDLSEATHVEFRSCAVQTYTQDFFSPSIKSVKIQQATPFRVSPDAFGLVENGSLESLELYGISHESVESMQGLFGFLENTQIKNIFMESQPSSGIKKHGDSRLDLKFANSKSLKAIALHKMNIESIILAGTNNAETMDFSSNSLRSVPKVDGNSLRSLDLSHNHIKVLKKDSFKGMSKLKTLSLKDNDISDIEAGALKGLNLTDLIVNENYLRRVDFTSACDLHCGVRSLNLADNSLVTISPTIFTSLIDLERLNMSNNKIDLIPGNAMRPCSLTWLSVSYNKIKQIEKGAFALCNDLKTLDMDENVITNIDKVFRDQCPMEAISFDRNSLTHIARGTFDRCYRLKSLRLSGNVGLNYIRSPILTKVPLTLDVSSTCLCDVNFLSGKEVNTSAWKVNLRETSLSCTCDTMKVIKGPGVFNGSCMAGSQKISFEDVIKDKSFKCTKYKPNCACKGLGLSSLNVEKVKDSTSEDHASDGINTRQSGNGADFQTKATWGDRVLLVMVTNVLHILSSSIYKF